MRPVYTKYILISRLLVASFFSMVCPILSSGQIINLVPDPSFEDTLPVISLWTQWSLKNWKNLDTNRIQACRSVYFSINNPNPSIQLPINNWCNQYPRSGGGIVALTFQYNNSPVDLKSITRVKLKNKLNAGEVYCAKIHAVFTERYAPFITDGLQLYFDNGGLDTMIRIHNDSSSYYPKVIPQVSLSQVLTDTTNWNLIMGSFVANGTEEYLTIGNFKNDSATTKVVINPSTLNDPGATILIDDVAVYPIDLANWLPATYGYPIGDSALIGLPNYETPDAKWYTYNMQLIDSGSQIKVLPPASGTKYICGIDLCNTTVYDTVTVVQWPLAINDEELAMSPLSVYPNPASERIIVKHVVGDKVRLYNAVGELVLEKQVLQNHTEIAISNLPKGLYFVQDKNRMVKWIKE